MEQRRSEQTTNRALAFLEGEVETWAKVQGVPLSELSPKECMVRKMHWSWAAQMQPNTLFQYQEGFISESQWDVIAERILVSWNNCQIKGFYNFRFLETACTDYLETLPDECSNKRGM